MLIKSQRERTYYYESKVVAKNRRPRFEQEGPALSDWFNEQVSRYGLAEAKRMRSMLAVKKSRRGYNRPDRIMPGAIFLYDGRQYVVSGQLSNGQYLRAVGDAKTNYPAKKCRITAENSGLVYL